MRRFLINEIETGSVKLSGAENGDTVVFTENRWKGKANPARCGDMEPRGSVPARSGGVGRCDTNYDVLRSTGNAHLEYRYAMRQEVRSAATQIKTIPGPNTSWT